MALKANVTYQPMKVSLHWNEASPAVPVLEVYLDGSSAGTIFRRNGTPGGTSTGRRAPTRPARTTRRSTS
jgi:hypothetical protein